MVDPDHQGHGIGRRLLDRFVREQAAAWLCTHEAAPARRLYESAGLTPIDLRAHQRSIDRLRMEQLPHGIHHRERAVKVL